MARKSRKNIGIAIETKPEAEGLCPTGIYVRLSIENSGKDDAGNSIENQTSLCREYLSEHPDLKLYEIYTDNGEKGTDFDRPEFNRMMKDARTGKIKCIIVKDLSRFGRDYIETGNYLEKIFPFLGIRFVSVTDQYDSTLAEDAEEALLIPLKNMINEMYAKDISRKIITAFRARQEKAEVLPAFAPYGYVKSKTRKYRYEVDEEVADYVRMMFEWKAAGVSHAEISNRLNDMGAVTPARRKVDLGIWHAEKYKHTYWHGRTITDILTNPTYTGCIVYGRNPKSLYEGIKMHHAPKEEWRIMPDMHEAIVSQELFDKVQDIFEKNKRVIDEKTSASKELRVGIVNLFQKKIYCGDCGKRMRFIRAQENGRKNYSSFACGGYIDSNYRKCSRHHIRYEAVCEAVLSAVKEQIAVCSDMEKLFNSLKHGTKHKTVFEQYSGKIAYLTAELTKLNIRREQLYENVVEGLLDEEEYQFAKNRYSKEAEELSMELATWKNRKEALDKAFTFDSDWTRAVKAVGEEPVLTQELVDSFVERVLIYEDKRVEVVFRYAESRNEMVCILEEMKKEEM